MNAPPKNPKPGTAQITAQKSHMVQRWQQGSTVQTIDQVAEETPVALVYNGISHAVMLATPQSLDVFATGFSLSEGIIQNRSEIFSLDIAPGENGTEVQMTIAQERFFRLKERRRNLTGRTGCGLCGTESLAQVRRPLPAVTSGLKVTPQALHKALDGLPEKQILQKATGAVHAAAWAKADGSVIFVEEDIGRHNALDKLIGRMAVEGADFTTGFALVTSRASYEMVQKSAMLKIPMLAAVSAPTSLAIDLAEAAGLTLAGFARPGTHVIYAHPQRITAAEPEK